MLKEIIKSTSFVFTDRINSPMYGAWFFSWFTINWRIWYYTFFVSHNDKTINKVDYIWNNYINIWSAFLLPLLSTAIIIFLLPYVSNKILKITLNHKKKAKEIKDKIEESVLLTHEESNNLRRWVANQGMENQKILEAKDKSISELKKQIELLNQELIDVSGENENELNENYNYNMPSEPTLLFFDDEHVEYELNSIPSEDRDDIKKLLKDKKLRNEFLAIYNALIDGTDLLNMNSFLNLSYFHSLNIFDKNSINNSYEVTDKAKRFYKLIKDREKS